MARLCAPGKGKRDKERKELPQGEEIADEKGEGGADNKMDIRDIGKVLSMQKSS